MEAAEYLHVFWAIQMRIFIATRKVPPHHSSAPYTFCVMVKWHCWAGILKCISICQFQCVSRWHALTYRAWKYKKIMLRWNVNKVISYTHWLIALPFIAPVRHYSVSCINNVAPERKSVYFILPVLPYHWDSLNFWSECQNMALAKLLVASHQRCGWIQVFTNRLLSALDRHSSNRIEIIFI